MGSVGCAAVSHVVVWWDGCWRLAAGCWRLAAGCTAWLAALRCWPPWCLFSPLLPQSACCFVFTSQKCPSDPWEKDVPSFFVHPKAVEVSVAAPSPLLEILEHYTCYNCRIRSRSEARTFAARFQTSENHFGVKKTYFRRKSVTCLQLLICLEFYELFWNSGQFLGNP